MDAQSEEESYMPYGERPEWQDVVPMPQQDAQNGLVPIAYSVECEFFVSHYHVAKLC